MENLYLFGSALRQDFNEHSDIDFVVKFSPVNPPQYFENYLSLKENLEALFGRKVDLVEEQTLKNPVLRRNIERSKEQIYG